MARDAIDIKESLGALVMRPRSAQRLHEAKALCATDDPGNASASGELDAVKAEEGK